MLSISCVTTDGNAIEIFGSKNHDLMTHEPLKSKLALIEIKGLTTRISRTPQQRRD